MKTFFIPPVDCEVTFFNSTNTHQQIFIKASMLRSHTVVIPPGQKVAIIPTPGSKYEDIKGASVDVPEGVSMELKMHPEDAVRTQRAMESIMGCMPPGSNMKVSSLIPDPPKAFDVLTTLLHEKALREQMNQTWVSVDESLPQKDLEVEIICEIRRVSDDKPKRVLFAGSFNPGDGWQFIVAGAVRHALGNVICWRYIDEETRKILDHQPPKESINENSACC